MKNPLSLALFVGGAIFVTYGVSASDGMNSGISNIFTRTPTAHLHWMTVGGGAAACIGLAGMLRGARKNFLAANRHGWLPPRGGVVPHDPFGASSGPAVNRQPVPVSVLPDNHANSTQRN